MADTTVSGAVNPYIAQAYSIPNNDKNTLSISDYFQLMAAQLANQDMTNPMSTSEMMNQMTQLSVVQTVTAVTEALQTSQAITTQTYAAGLVGQEVSVAQVDGEGNMVGIRYGTVASVNLSYSPPVVLLKGDNTEYSLTNVIGMGSIPNPFEDGEGGGSVEGPAEDSTGDLIEGPAEGSAEDTIKDPTEDSTESAIKDTTEDSVENMVKDPAEESTEETAEGSIVNPTEETV